MRGMGDNRFNPIAYYSREMSISTVVRMIIQDPTWNSGYTNIYTHQYVTQFSTKYFDISQNEFAKDHLKRSDSFYYA